MSTMRFADPGTPARSLHLIHKEGLADWLKTQDNSVRSWVEAAGFKAGIGEVLLLQDETGVNAALGGMGRAQDASRKRFVSALLRPKLPTGVWAFETELTGAALSEAALGWL